MAEASTMTGRKVAPRVATLAATAVEVHCPYCGGAQPDPDVGSFQWTPEQIKQHEGVRDCSECDAQIRVMYGRKAEVC